MSYFMPLFSLVFGLFGFAYAGAQVMEAPPPASYPAPTADGGSYTMPVQICPEVTLKCDFGYTYDNVTGCAKDECAPDPAIQQREWDVQCVKDKQRELKDFERYSIKDAERRFKELERSKVAVPAEARTAFEQMKARWQQAQGLSVCQELNDVTKEMYDFSNDLNSILRDAEDVMNAARCLKDAQRELKDFERYNIKEVERKIQQATKKKITVPESITGGLARVKEFYAAAKNATNCNDIQDAKNEMYNAGNEVQDAARQLDFLMQMPQMQKQITQELKNIERQWKTAANRAKRGKADLSELVTRGQGLLDTMKALFEDIKAAFASGDMERIRDVLEGGDSEARDHENEIFEIIRTIDALSNAPRYLKELDRRVKDTKRQAKDMARFNKIDTSSLIACLDNAAPLITAAKEESNRRPTDPDALMDAFSTVEETLSDCDEIRHSLEGKQEEFFGEFIPDQMFMSKTAPVPAGPSPLPQ